MRGVAIVSPVRTAVGGFGGSLRSVSAADLASTVIKEVLSRTGLAAENVDDVILGHGYPSGKVKFVPSFEPPAEEEDEEGRERKEVREMKGTTKKEK